MLQEWNQFNYQTKINNQGCDSFENQIGEISIIQDDQVKRSCQNQLNCLQFKGHSLCSNSQIEEINFLAQRLGISGDFTENVSQYGTNQQISQNQIPEFQRENIEMKMNFIDKIHQSLVNYNLNAPIFYYQNSDNIVINMNQNNSTLNAQNKLNTQQINYLNESLIHQQQQDFNIPLQQKINAYDKKSDKSQDKKRKSSKKKSQKQKDNNEKREILNSSSSTTKEINKYNSKQEHRIISKEDKENINLSQSVLVDSVLMPLKGILKQDKKFVTFEKQSNPSPYKKNNKFIPQSNNIFYSNQDQQYSQETSSNSSNDNQFDQSSFVQECQRESVLNNSSRFSNNSQQLRKYSSGKKTQNIQESEDLNQAKCKRIQRTNQTPQSNKRDQNSHLNLSCEEKQRELSINQVKFSPIQKSFMSQTISSELRKSDKKPSNSKERKERSLSKNSNRSQSKGRNNSQNEYQSRRASKNSMVQQEQDKKSQYYQSKWLIDTTNKTKQSKNDIDMINKLYEKAISNKSQPYQNIQQKNFIEDNKNSISNISQRRNQHKNWDEIIKKEFNIQNRQIASTQQKNNLNESSSSASFFQDYVYKDQNQSDYYKRKYVNN